MAVRQILHSRLGARTALFLFTLCFLTGLAKGLDKDELLAKYRKKYLIVIDAGVVTGVCPDTGDVAVRVKSGEDLKTRDNGCATEPVSKGEVLRITSVSFRLGNLYLYVENVAPHAATRGNGAFAHESVLAGT